MTNFLSTNKQTPQIAKRFQQTVLFTIFLLLMAISANIYFNEPDSIQNFIILDVIVMFGLFPLISRGKIDLAKQIFLWSNLFVLSVIFWSQGGILSSSVILIYPIFLMIAALLVGPRTF